MHAHFVLAHPEPKSFNSHLVRVGAEAFASNGWATSVSDLYAVGFDPCERFEQNRLDTDRFDPQAEQRHLLFVASHGYG
jgi:NAD(P)H dehydrogenase (quinone)